jgi:ketosteroid isomerase-like protein
MDGKWTAWIDAWNGHDLDAVLALYADDVTFTSPMVRALGGDARGSVHGKDALRELFAAGLRAFPDLRFTPILVFGGVDRSALFYSGVGGRLVLEVHAHDAQGRIARAWALHAPPPRDLDDRELARHLAALVELCIDRARETTKETDT